MSCKQSGLIPPNPDIDSQEWWAAVAKRRFLVPRCETCLRSFFPPMPTCPHCSSPTIELLPASGEASIYSWIVVHRALDPAYVADVPYTVVTVDLAEGGRMVGRLCEGEPEAGGRVRATFYEVDGQVLVGFQPV